MVGYTDFSGRFGPGGVVVGDNQVLVMGGSSDSPPEGQRNDVWSSCDRGGEYKLQLHL